jgi:uracil-DNA glycosylase
MTAKSRRDLYLQEMGLGPLWRLRNRPASPAPVEAEKRAPPDDRAARIRLAPSWKARLLAEFSRPYMHELREFLKGELAAGKVIYPRGTEYFTALDSTSFDEVKVVILGQDPYHGPNQAHGLCFSVRAGVEIPPSLQNIFIELKDDLGIEPPDHGNLAHWAAQGVLLLNATLSVEAGRAGSHQNKGWEIFTDAVIQALDREREGLVFVLWGSYAQKKGAFIDTQKHLVLKGPHPSLLSAHRGFFGCRHFSRINEYLQQRGRTPIDWRLPKLG